MQENLVSIITPMYNSEKYVGRTIESVLSQTYKEWEMIIVNDGSIDNSVKIVEKYADKDSRINLINQPNGGCASARNNALRNASGRYVCFLDSDDLWEPDFLSSQVEFLKEKNAAFVYSSHKRIDDDDNEILVPFIVPERLIYTNLLKTCSISTLTVVIDLNKVGNISFNEYYEVEDYALWLDLLKEINCAYGNKKILASYRIRKGSRSRNKYKITKSQFVIYYKKEKLGLLRSIYYTLSWAINGYLKYRK